MGRDAFHPRPHYFRDGVESVLTGFRVISCISWLPQGSALCVPRSAFPPRPHSFRNGVESVATNCKQPQKVAESTKGADLGGRVPHPSCLAPLAPLCGHPLRWRVSAFVFVSTFVCSVCSVVTPGDRGQGTVTSDRYSVVGNPQSALRVSGFRPPRSAFRTPHSAFRRFPCFQGRSGIRPYQDLTFSTSKNARNTKRRCFFSALFGFFCG